MPAQCFIDEFLPNSSEKPEQVCPGVNKQPFLKIPEGTAEKSVYVLLADVIRHFALDFEVVDTSQHPSGGIEYGGCKLRSDLTWHCIPRVAVAQESPTLNSWI
ncbi:hypothetical protein K503DRAFT_227670 [Rhizopogon vinicolor AM-OR11-026]|uniref:Uncharacterized protein n=1 Tax=Rhizopogon vinicolor AM-OR11-026 TaxID=1314800 RepID=A0A1B7MY87_9AGAM|nr:hypothetical protein K503DRAFT_227670 [Rhizopogon vinicolor AM-OR11-026]